LHPQNVDRDVQAPPARVLDEPVACNSADLRGLLDAEKDHVAATRAAFGLLLDGVLASCWRRLGQCAAVLGTPRHLRLALECFDLDQEVSDLSDEVPGGWPDPLTALSLQRLGRQIPLRRQRRLVEDRIDDVRGLRVNDCGFRERLNLVCHRASPGQQLRRTRDCRIARSALLPRSRCTVPARARQV